MALTLADAHQMIQAAIAKAEELQVKLSLAWSATRAESYRFQSYQWCERGECPPLRAREGHRVSGFWTRQWYPAGGLAGYPSDHRYHGGTDAARPGRGTGLQSGRTRRRHWGKRRDR